MKRKTHKRRRAHTLSASPRRRSRRRSALHGMLSGSELKNGAVNVGMGVLGGIGANVGNKLLAGLNLGTWGKIFAGAGIGLVASTMGAPKIGSGFAGGMTALALAGGLSEDELSEDELSEDELSEDELSEPGIYQTEDGNLVKMLNDGSVEYLSEDEITALNEGEKPYPNYSTMYNF